MILKVIHPRKNVVPHLDNQIGEKLVFCFYLTSCHNYSIATKIKLIINYFIAMPYLSYDIPPNYIQDTTKCQQ